MVSANRGATQEQVGGLVPVATLVILGGCLLVGIAGGMLSYARPLPPVPEPPPVIAEVLNVELTSANVLPSELPPPRSLTEPPPLAPLAAPATPPPMAVAAPSPQIAFAVPIEAPARIAPAAEASFRNLDTPVSQLTPVPPVARSLTFGQGEGKQPAPDYPRLALRGGQEGVVTVRLSVAEDGRVLTAEAASPSPWPLLNDAAVRVVKNRWRFGPGIMRLYEVAIRFQINK